MGCCLSTKNHSLNSSELQHRSDNGKGEANDDVPVQPDEETVKEVLLETPVTVANVSKKSNINEETVIKLSSPEMRDQWGIRDTDKIRPSAHVATHYYKSPQILEKEKSIISEINDRHSEATIDSEARCYGAESISKTDKSAVYGEERVDQRPPARRRRETTEGKKYPTPRNVDVNDNGRVRSTNANDHGGSARRSSRFPVTRVGHPLGDKKSEERTTKASEEPPLNDVVTGEEAESLEYPVVSLECFIFL